MKPNPMVEKRDSGLPEGRRFELLHLDSPARNMRRYHWHGYSEISYIRKGRGQFEIENRVCDVKPGDVVFVNDYQRHRVRYHNTEKLYETVLHIEGGYLRQIGAFLMPPFPDLDDVGRTKVRKIIEEIVREYRNREIHYQTVIAALVLQLSACVHRYDTRQNQARMSARSRQQTRSDRIDEIIDFIFHHSREPITLERVSRRFSMSSGYFSSKFREWTGVTFSDFLADIRVQKAKELINIGGLSADEIASRSGFTSRDSFYRWFRKVTGMNPGEYRRIGQSSRY